MVIATESGADSYHPPKLLDIYLLIPERQTSKRVTVASVTTDPIHTSVEHN